MAAKKKAKKKVAKKKVSKKKTAKHKPLNRGRLPRAKQVVTKAENDAIQKDIVYTNGNGKPDNGRPPKSAKLSQIRALAAIGCTQTEMAAVCGMNKDSFTQLKKNNHPLVSDVIKFGRAEGTTSLRRRQHEVAMAGDTHMLKWLGKNRLNQSERIIAHTESSTGDTLRKAIMGEDDSDEDNEGSED